MPEDWPVGFNGFEYAPASQSWLAHPRADDQQYNTPRPCTVSAVTYGHRTLKLRYSDPRTGNALVLQLPACKHDTGVVPEALVTGRGWARSLTLSPRDEPQDVLRRVEQQRFRSLWVDSGLLLGRQRVVADVVTTDAAGVGTGCFVVAGWCCRERGQLPHRSPPRLAGRWIHRYEDARQRWLALTRGR